MKGWEAEDWAAFRPIATDPEVMRYISGGQPWPDDRIREFVSRQIRHLSTHGFCLWKLVDKRDDRLLGFCGIQPVTIAGRDEIEIGWWLARDQWRKGLGAEAAKAALRDGFERATLPRIIAIAQPANRPSIHVMEKLGMHYERDAVHKGIQVVIYCIERSNYSPAV